MSTYNEYLHHDLKELGYMDYIKMLDGEKRFANLNFLTTQERLSEPPFFGKYSANITFAIVNPLEDSGKRPYIGLICTTIFEVYGAKIEPGLVHEQIYYPPFPNKLQMKQDVTLTIEKIIRNQIPKAAYLPQSDYPNSITNILAPTRQSRR